MGFSTGKRKSRDEEEDTVSVSLTSEFPIDDLSDDVLERVLSWLPTSCFFRMSSVCKRWKSSQTSKSFKLACSQVPTRDPWFFMIDNDINSSFVYDTTENNWKNLNCRESLHHHRSEFIPVASSGGLLCYRCSISGEFLFRNPLTGSFRYIPSPISQDNNNKPLQAVAMTTTVTPSSYSLITISGEIPNLSFRIYESNSDSWSKDQELKLDMTNDSSHDDSDTDIGIVYFLSKTGNVVVASNNLQRSPSKQYSSVITVTDNAQIVYFLSSYGTAVACDLTKQCFTELPKLLPPSFEYSIDLVECNGTMYVILLSEFFESASLRIWTLDKNKNWVHVGMLPPSLSHELYGTKGDINCVGGVGNKILVCFNGSPPDLYCRYFVYDLAAQEWSELPRCFKDGEAVDFISALSLQPRIEATV